MSNSNNSSKKSGAIGNLLRKIGVFAKEKPALFAVIIVAGVFSMLFVTYESLHLTSTPTFCGTCHKETETGPGAEFYTWEKNVHSFAGVGCIDCHGAPGILGYAKAKMGGLYDLYGEVTLSKEEKLEVLSKPATDVAYAEKLVPNDWCLVCHSDADNKRIRDEHFMSAFGVKMRLVDGVINPEFRKEKGLPDIMTDSMPTINISHDNHVNSLGLSCMSCHQGVAHGGEFSNKTKMETCFTCHDQERAKNPDIIAPKNEDCASCHSLVVEQQEGTLLEAQGVEKTPPSMMADVGVYGADNCSSCHVDATTPPTRETCGETCHGEGVSYESIFDDTRKDYDERKKPLDILLVKFYKERGRMTAEQIEAFNKFKYYHNIIASDASKGIHNGDLANITFDKADEIANELSSSLGIKTGAN